MNLVQQGDNDCALACLAMLSNKTLEEIHSLYPKFNGVGTTTEEILYLLQLLELDYVLYANPKLVYGRLYLVTVPSLNKANSSHAIIVDLRDWEYSEDGSDTIIGCTIYDPNQDNSKGKQWYSYKDLPLPIFYEVIEILQ